MQYKMIYKKIDFTTMMNDKNDSEFFAEVLMV